MTVCHPQHFIERIRAGLAAARERGRIVGRRRIMTRAIINRTEDMLIAGATRQQVADVTGVDVKTIYKYLPVQYGDKKSP
ncbi:helix-turn-helix domain-containing protein [Klebsiella variicola]